MLFCLVEKRCHLFLGDGGDSLGRAFGCGDGVGDSPVLYWREGDNVILLLMKVLLLVLLVLLHVSLFWLSLFPPCLLFARYVWV